MDCGLLQVFQRVAQTLTKISIIIAYVQFLLFKCHAFGDISRPAQKRGFTKGHNMKLQEFSRIRKSWLLLTP